jgi:hypothetical protein
MAQVSRKSHFISACYLARFTDAGTEEGRLCGFDLVADRFFQQRPKNVAYELDFNRVEIDGHPRMFWRPPSESSRGGLHR